MIIIASCGDNSTGPEPNSNTGILKVTTKTVGIQGNNAGYSIVFSASSHKITPIGANATTYVKHLSQGSHVVSLTGLASGCSVEGDNPRTIHTSAEDTTSTTFAISCGNQQNDKVCGVSKQDISSFTHYIGFDPSDQMKEALTTAINKYGVLFGITSKAHMQHFLAQMAAESSGFTDLVENLNYSVQGLLNVFGNYFSQTDPSLADPDVYAGKPKKIANLVYANRLGNGGVASGDGYRYRGRGVIQLTGRTNYSNFTYFYKSNIDDTKNFITKSTLVASNKQIASISGLWFFKKYVLDVITVDENTSVKAITLQINGGLNGLSRRKQYYLAVQQTISNCQ